VADNVYCLVKIIQKDERIIAAVQLEIKLFDLFLSVYTAHCRNALHRLRVHMNIILLWLSTSMTLNYPEPPKLGVLVNFSRFRAATYISRVNCDAGDRPIQLAALATSCIVTFLH